MKLRERKDRLEILRGQLTKKSNQALLSEFNEIRAFFRVRMLFWIFIFLLVILGGVVSLVIYNGDKPKVIVAFILMFVVLACIIRQISIYLGPLMKGL